jgi:cell division protease FtsH
VLHNTARVLMEREQIDGDEFQRILVQNKVQQYLKQDAPDVAVPYQDAKVAA